MSRTQLTWVILNHYKDQEEEFDRLTKPICRFVNPEAASKIFDVDLVEEEVQSSNDEFLNEINSRKYATKQYSSDEIATVLEAEPADDGLDRIEVVENNG